MLNKENMSAHTQTWRFMVWAPIDNSPTGEAICNNPKHERFNVVNCYIEQSELVRVAFSPPKGLLIAFVGIVLKNTFQKASHAQFRCLVVAL